MNTPSTRLGDDAVEGSTTPPETKDIPPTGNNLHGAHGRGLPGSPPDLVEIQRQIDDRIKEIRADAKHPINVSHKTEYVDPDYPSQYLTRRGHEYCTICSSEIQADLFTMFAEDLWSDHEVPASLRTLEKAIKCRRKAVASIEEGHFKKPKLLHVLGLSLCGRSQRYENLEDINEAIECYRQAVLLTSEGHADRLIYLNNLGLSLSHRFGLLGEQIDLNQAIEYHSQSIRLAADDHPSKPKYWSNLGNCLYFRFALSGNLVDLDEAMSCHTRAVQLTPQGCPTLLNNLAQLLLKRYEQYNRLSDLDRAVEYASQAVDLAPEGHINRPSYLSNLGWSRMRQFEQRGYSMDINKAIECLEQAVECTPKDDTRRAGYLHQLGCSSARRFEWFGNVEDMDKSIEHLTEAIQLTPEWDLGVSCYLNSLGSAWMSRYERLGDPADIDNAIKYGEQAVKLTPEGDVDKPLALMNLGSSYSSRFRRFQRPEDIDNAIRYQARAVQLTPNGHANKYMCLSSLGYSWAFRFAILGERADLDSAIKYQTQAVHAIPEGHSEIPCVLNNLGNSFRCRYEQSGNLGDLDKAIDYLTQAVQCIPEGYKGKPHFHLNLGRAWMVRFRQSNQRTDLDAARISFQDGAQPLATSPETQINCARSWASCSIKLGLSPLEAFQRLFSLIPHLVWMGTVIQKRYNKLVKINDVTAKVVAWAVSVEEYDLAIEWLEEGRSIVWNQILQLRSPFDDLAVIDPGLACRLKGIASELESASSRTTDKSGLSRISQQDLEHQARHHRRLAAQWDQLIAEARQLNGLRNFLQPRKAQELKEAVSRGPFVIINTHPSRCDALIMFPGHQEVMHVALNEFTEAKAVECRAQMVSLVGHRGNGNEARGVKRYDKHAISNDQLLPLKTLWSDVVGPVLDALAITRKRPYHELPHITWCATGAMSLLPLHAAGLYDGTSPNTFDLVISSYTPTMSALLAHTAHANQPCAGVLAVGQANSPDFPPLPKTVEELTIIKKHASATPFEQLDGPLATVDATLNAMENHSWVHLACHATQNRADPSQSAFHLHDRKLTLATITKRAFKNKGLAFLSACQTATGDDELPDEATHLAAGMLMAGYPSVIATMWSIMDEDAPEVADEVYAELIQDGKMDHTNAAMALHKAVGKLREKVGLESIGRWAPFVYIGV